jgi:hypothetical protein
MVAMDLLDPLDYSKVHGALVGAWSGQYNEEVANSVVLVL